MIKIAVCDDDLNDISLIKNELDKYAKLCHEEFEISEFSNPEMLLYELEDGIIADIFILDVSMPNINGFELADRIRKFTETSVIIFFPISW